MLATPIICVVTRARGMPGSPERAVLIERLRSAASAGASMIQIRERLLDDRSFVHFTHELIEAVTHTECAVIINDRVDLALAAGARGVHLKSGGVAAADVRSIARDRLLIGRSLHSLDDAVAAEQSGGYDYLLFGTVFPSTSKPAGHPVAGLEVLNEICARTTLPVLAIGGISPARGEAVARAGAAGIAAISFFAEARDMAQAVAQMQASLTRHRGGSKLLEDG